MPQTLVRRSVLSLTLLTSAALAGLAAPVRAELVIGGTFNATGPNAPIGIPGKNAFSLYPATIAGQPVKYISLDDACDPTQAARNMRRFTEEDKADIVVGSTCTPGCMAMGDVALEHRTAHICLSPIVPRNPWAFTLPQTPQLMVDGLVEHMKAGGAKTVAYIGFSDGWGDLNYDALMKFAPAAGIKVLSNERYARPDTSVTPQVLKIFSLNPDVVYVGASAAPAALPSIALAERGYRGRIYHSPAVVNPDFLRVGGKAVEGSLIATGPFAVREQLPDSHPTKKAGLAFASLYDAKFGAGTVNPFAAYSWDALQWLNAAVPVALKKAQPGTPAFREALREAIENLREVAGTHAVYTLSPANHNGVDGRGRVIVRVENGAFRLVN
jgi:branched-chain amino acid transport system substrate-binding protein